MRLKLGIFFCLTVLFSILIVVSFAAKPKESTEPTDSLFISEPLLQDRSIDIYGNQIEPAVIDYRIDRYGKPYEHHWPDTALLKPERPST